MVSIDWKVWGVFPFRRWKDPPYLGLHGIVAASVDPEGLLGGSKAPRYLPAMGIMDESGINSRKAGTSFLDDGRNFGLIS